MLLQITVPAVKPALISRKNPVYAFYYFTLSYRLIIIGFGRRGELKLITNNS
ncbi:hypothetical protein KJ784_03365 [Patescibacteria group bacterium]|nr:hypothetical protein [Patescibacteria group bacterium]